MSEPIDALLGRARAWAAEDPDEQTRAELEALITTAEAGGETDLADRFAGTLEFGTAGLRGALGAGPNRMNRVVVTRAAAGLAAYLKDTGHAGGSVVIGFDARHNSDAFARDTAEIMTGAGFKALVMPRPLPTPLLAFAIRELGCAAGVMVTASHNPPQDNGYKVYLGDGSQIVPPADGEIAARIAAVGALADLPRGTTGKVVGEEIVDRYLDTVAGLAGDGPRDLSIVYTPLHGVGGTTVAQVLETAGFDAPHIVEQQEHPDPEFPTVAFPNPEEPGAMDLAMALAERHHADIVVANDPDADRCAVAVPGPHGWRMLRGDEVGALLAHHLILRGATGTYANSIVSSQPARQDGEGCRPAPRGDPDRLQVDRPRRGPGVRLRGGARLLLRPRARPGQGRRLRAAAGLRARRGGQGRGPRPHRHPRRHRARPRAARDRPALGPLRRPRRDPRDHGAAARAPRPPRSAASPSSASTTSRSAPPSCLPPTGCATRWPRAPA